MDPGVSEPSAWCGQHTHRTASHPAPGSSLHLARFQPGCGNPDLVDLCHLDPERNLAGDQPHPFACEGGPEGLWDDLQEASQWAVK